MKKRLNDNDDLIPYQAGEACDPAVRQYLDASLASNTLVAYGSDLKHFAAWGGDSLNLRAGRQLCCLLCNASC